MTYYKSLVIYHKSQILYVYYLRNYRYIMLVINYTRDLL
jgi:hypothetical protein